MTKADMIEMIKQDLNAGLVFLELSDEIIENNLERALLLSSDSFNYTDFKTMNVTMSSASGGYIPLTGGSEEECVDPNGIPTIIKVYPTSGVMNVEAALLGLGSMFIGQGAQITGQIYSYAQMVQHLSNLESILGRGAKVVGDKLYVDKYHSMVTVEYIPQKVSIEKIHEGSWIRWLIEYTAALCKRQLSQSRGKFIVDSNPSKINHAELIAQANDTILKLEEELKTKGVLFVSR